MSAKLTRAAALAGGLLALAAGCAEAQAGQEGGTLAARVARAPDGEVRLHFSSRPGVCGNVEGDNVMIGRTDGGPRNYTGSWNGRDRRETECVEGPTHLRLRVRGGRVSDVSARVARGWAAGEGRVTDLGRVPARQAADYLLTLAERSTDGEVAEDAVFPATLADSVESWPRLLRIARSQSAHDRARRSAVFWLSQQAGEEVTKGLAGLVDDDAQDRGLREQAVFALSQRPRDEAVPALIRIARSHRDGHIRKTALFWLGQSGDPRAVALFEEILSN